MTATSGRGFGLYVKGDRISSVSDLHVGDLLLEHSPQFNADNTIIVSRELEDRVYVHFVNPNNWRQRWGQDFCIWDFDVEHGTTQLWRAVPTRPTVDDEDA